MWLAQVGRERMEETLDPELTIDRALSQTLLILQWCHPELFPEQVDIIGVICEAAFHGGFRYGVAIS